MIAQHIAAIRARILDAAKAADRTPDAVRLIAVSKTRPVSDVLAALEAGQSVFGENRVQEAKAKFAALAEIAAATLPKPELHLIGPLQTNKVEDAVRLFDVIQTLDRPKLAAALATAIVKIGRAPKLYIEINIGAEEQKAGIAPARLADFLGLCRDTHKLAIDGLMCIPPHEADPAPFFAELKRLADTHHLPQVSMGMSADFETAIAQGATQVRVGTALFGARQYTTENQ